MNYLLVVLAFSGGLFSSDVAIATGGFQNIGACQKVADYYNNLRDRTGQPIFSARCWPATD